MGFISFGLGVLINLYLLVLKIWDTIFGASHSHLGLIFLLGGIR
jgi:hypothetical protein